MSDWKSLGRTTECIHRIVRVQRNERWIEVCLEDGDRSVVMTVADGDAEAVLWASDDPATIADFDALSEGFLAAFFEKDGDKYDALLESGGFGRAD